MPSEEAPLEPQGLGSTYSREGDVFDTFVIFCVAARSSHTL